MGGPAAEVNLGQVAFDGWPNKTHHIHDAIGLLLVYISSPPLRQSV